MIEIYLLYIEIYTKLSLYKKFFKNKCCLFNWLNKNKKHFEKKYKIYKEEIKELFFWDNFFKENSIEIQMSDK